MNKVVKWPIDRKYPRTVIAKEMYAQKEPPEEMVWALCPYTRGVMHSCHHCPEWEDDPEHGEYSRGCYVLAKEAVRTVFAMQNRQKAVDNQVKLNAGVMMLKRCLAGYEIKLSDDRCKKVMEVILATIDL
jgi:hypothetical protein